MKMKFLSPAIFSENQKTFLVLKLFPFFFKEVDQTKFETLMNRPENENREEIPKLNSGKTDRYKKMIY